MLDSKSLDILFEPLLTQFQILRELWTENNAESDVISYTRMLIPRQVGGTVESMTVQITCACAKNLVKDFTAIKCATGDLTHYIPH
jgi:hypothetical protein